MPSLTDRQSLVIETLFAGAPDAAVRRLEQALAEEIEQGGPLAEVHALIAREAAERRVRCAVLGPIMPLCRPSDLGDRRFPSPTITRLWTALRATQPKLVEDAETACLVIDDPSRPAQDIYNELCAFAAESLRDGDPDFEPVRQCLAQAGDDALDLFAGYLDLIPLARQAVVRLPEWLGRMSEERAATARLAYKDAVELSDDAGPRLVELLLAHLTEPWKILRILAAMVPRANERYLAESELGRFGGYIITDIEQRLAQFRTFDPGDGRAAGQAAAQHLHAAAQEVVEFETAMELSRDGPWGARVTRAKQLLAELADARLNQIEKAIDQALPLQLVRFGKGVRGAPKLSSDLDPRLVSKAEGLLGFFDGSRSSAASSGFGSTRAKVGDAMSARMEQYVEDLLEQLRAEEPGDLDRIHAYLDLAADFMGDLQGEKAASIVRRRAAAA